MRCQAREGYLEQRNSKGEEGQGGKGGDLLSAGRCSQGNLGELQANTATHSRHGQTGAGPGH